MAALDGSILIDEQKQDFTLKEEILYDLFGSEQKFPKDRVLRIILDTEKVDDLKGVLAFFEQVLLSAVGSRTDFTRWLKCSECYSKSEEGYFVCKENFKLKTGMERCTNPDEHDFKTKRLQEQSFQSTLNFELNDDMERCMPLGKHDKEDINGQHGSNRREHSDQLNDVDEIESSIGSENLKLIKRWIREGRVKLHDIRAIAIKMRGSVFGTYQLYERDELPVNIFSFMLQTWHNEKLCQPGVDGYQEIRNILNHEDVRLFALVQMLTPVPAPLTH